MSSTPLDRATVVAAPKVLLHDHLDGGLRVETLLELAEGCGYGDLPAGDPAALRQAILAAADRKDLVLYLEGFTHTLAVMQTAEALERIAYECVEDLALDGVVYAEVRFAPELLCAGGLSLDEALESVLAGFKRGRREHHTIVRAIVCAMRQRAHSRAIAELALRFRDRGVCGFDIAGPEDGYPPTRHLEAFSLLMAEQFPITIHAGEAFGPPSIAEALAHCGAIRLGHGARIVEDITTDPTGREHLGRLAGWVRDRRVPLELCPSANVHVGVSPTLVKHPIDRLARLGYRITVNTDNRLMSQTSLTDEYLRLSECFGWDLELVRWTTLNAIKSAFMPFDQRLQLIEEVIKPGFAQLGAVDTAPPIAGAGATPLAG